MLDAHQTEIIGANTTAYDPVRLVIIDFLKWHAAREQRLVQNAGIDECTICTNDCK
jgi:hypothetical protein